MAAQRHCLERHARPHLPGARREHAAVSGIPAIGGCVLSCRRGCRAGAALADASDALKQLSGTILEGTAGSGDAHPVGGVLPAGDAAAAGGIGETTLRIFQRCHIQMLLAAGQRDAALAESRRLLQACFSPEKDITLAGEEAASTLVWLVARGLPEAVDLVAADRPELIRDDPLVGYAAALAARARHDDVQANTLAAAAFAKPAGTNAEFVDRLQTAILLTKWGGADWAAREYTMLVDDQRTPAAQFAALCDHVLGVSARPGA